LECFDAAAVFPECRWSQVPAFAPEVLAGEAAHLQAFAAEALRHRWKLDSVTVAVFALTCIGQKPLTTPQRESLWRVFRVPSYELLIDRETGLLAAECEAHDGWHVRHRQLRFDLQTGKVLFQKSSPTAVPLSTGLTARGLDSCCACGDEAPVLRGIQLQPARPVRTRAVSA
jgi:hypothetical protein